MFAAAALAGCKGKNGAGDVQQDNRVLTKTETAESATVQRGDMAQSISSSRSSASWRQPIRAEPSSAPAMMDISVS